MKEKVTNVSQAINSIANAANGIKTNESKIVADLVSKIDPNKLTRWQRLKIINTANKFVDPLRKGKGFSRVIRELGTFAVKATPAISTIATNAAVAKTETAKAIANSNAAIAKAYADAGIWNANIVNANADSKGNTSGNADVGTFLNAPFK